MSLVIGSEHCFDLIGNDYNRVSSNKKSIDSEDWHSDIDYVNIIL